MSHPLLFAVICVAQPFCLLQAQAGHLSTESSAENHTALLNSEITSSDSSLASSSESVELHAGGSGDDVGTMYTLPSNRGTSRNAHKRRLLCQPIFQYLENGNTESTIEKYAHHHNEMFQKRQRSSQLVRKYLRLEVIFGGLSGAVNWMLGVALGSIDWFYSMYNHIRVRLIPQEKFFSDGLGDLELLTKYEEVLERVVSGEEPLPVVNGVKWNTTVDAITEEKMDPGTPIIETAQFETPFHEFLPEESRYGHIQVLEIFLDNGLF
jgi:hypothetical protein